MKSVYFGMVPSNAELLKRSRPETFTVMGTLVYCSEFFAALLEYSTYDSIILPATPMMAEGDMRDTAAYRNNAHRVRFVSEVDLALLRNSGSAVLSYPGFSLEHGHRLRRLARRSDLPIVGVTHSLNHTPLLQVIFRMLLQPLTPFDSIICSSHAGKVAVQRLIQLVEERMHRAGIKRCAAELNLPIIPLGVDTRRFDSLDCNNSRAELGLSSSPVLLYFGRISNTSKADLAPLLIVFAQLVAAGTDAWLLIAGDDTHHHQLEMFRKTAVILGCADRVRCIPNPSPEMKNQLYLASDVFVAPSDSIQETFGISLLEAMASGLAVVAADWSGYRDIITDGKDGLLVPTRMPILPESFETARGSGAMTNIDLLASTTSLDMPALYQALYDVTNDHELRKKLAHNATTTAKLRYSWKTVIRRHEELWGELCVMARRDDFSYLDREAIDLETSDYQRVFAHFATSTLTAHTRVVLPDQSGSTELQAAVLELTVGADHTFPVALAQRLLIEVAMRGSMSVGEAIDAMSPLDEAGRISAMLGVARLIKYGLLAVCS